MLVRAAGLYGALPGDHRAELGRVWLNQGRAIARVLDYAGADAAFARSEALYRAKYGTDHYLWADAARNRAWGAFEAGRLAEAEQRSDQAIRVYRRVLEGDHPTLAASLLLLGRIRTARGDATGALAAFAQASSIYGRLYGPTNAAVGDVDFYAAQAEAKRGDTDAALRRLAHTKTIYDASYGPDDPDQVELLMARAQILAEGGRLADARSDCAAGVALQTKLDPKDPTLDKSRKTCAALNRVAPLIL
jgi:tetratricopeptide (TPR) repeat protein